jgi:putative tryptophan/tyrosine transport system substrate-binding protein
MRPTLKDETGAKLFRSTQARGGRLMTSQFLYRRRELIALFGGTTIGWPPTARAQQKAMRTIGSLSGVSPESYAPFFAAFRLGLSDTGYTEGSNLVIEYRWAQDHPDRLPALAEDLVARNVEVIFASGGSPQVAKNATATIPIVFVAAGDLVAAGLVASFSRPGGNVTGVNIFTTELIPKRLQILHQFIPGVTTIAMLVPRAESFIAAVTDAAAKMGLQLRILETRTERDFAPAFAKLAQLRAGALLVSTDPLFTEHRDELVALAARYAIPASYAWREFVVAGGLISYGASLAGAWRQAGIYVGRILKGDKPADLPVEQPTKFELVINLNTAKALDLTIPPSILADEVIE